MFRLSQNERGAVLIESTIALPIFFAILVVGFDLLRISYNAVTVQYVASSVMRQASLGKMDASKLQDYVLGAARERGVPLMPEDVALCSANLDPDDCIGITAGDSIQLMILRINVPIRGYVFRSKLGGTKATRYFLQASSLGRMEPS